jgi:hypothetical protein
MEQEIERHIDGYFSFGRCYVTNGPFYGESLAISLDMPALTQTYWIEQTPPPKGHLKISVGIVDLCR